ncbi:MAG: Asparagine synthetase [glutamine-hydrolyzing] 1 [Chlamydiales bacterium]|nr:Asparagine synthetase [glutamine-hydrolyzing] 1 [Chlamydiales bacterium]MCH9620498.1 Asparagine synthetase [glutamine-hydrolyzing] 1 [Chlamydiales bacterium]MCH9623483.1 Asparagine synthetase [glutamine-hydrolyzing] 1 [Chlamydiales bacterium]
MPNLTGIIYPDAFQVTNLIKEVSSLYPHQSSKEFFRFKNLELASFEKKIISNEQKTIWTLFSGKILNAKALREELVKLGFKFKTEEEEEVLFNGYEAWGEAFLSRLNGPYALALFDAKKEALLIARDPIGQKCLYWSDQGDYWLFSTEIKGLLATGLVPQNPSPSTLSTFLHFGYIPQDLSLIQGVNKLLPGHHLWVNLKQHWSIGQHYSLSDQIVKTHSISLESALEQFGEHMKNAVTRSIIPDQELGSIVTPDLGSTSLNWFLSHQAKNLHPISEERNSLSENLSHLVEMVWHLDEPIADPSTLHTWQLAQQAKQSSCYAYSSLGWKQLLAGDPRFFSYGEELALSPPLSHTLATLPPFLRDDLLIPLLRAFHLPYRYKILRNVDINRNLITYLLNSALFKGKNRKNASPFLDHYFNLEVFTQRFHRLGDLPGKINQSLYFDMKTHLPDCSLHQYDRLFSNQGVTLLCPFLDIDLLTFLVTLPDEVKFQKELPGHLLHKLMEKLSPTQPQPLKERAPSYKSWANREQIRLIFSSLERGRLVEEGLISKKWIAEQVSYPELADRSFRQLWSILILEIWFRLYINRPIGMQPYDVTIEELLEITLKI